VAKRISSHQSLQNGTRLVGCRGLSALFSCGCSEGGDGPKLELESRAVDVASSEATSERRPLSSCRSDGGVAGGPLVDDVKGSASWSLEEVAVKGTGMAVSGSCAKKPGVAAVSRTQG